MVGRERQRETERDAGDGEGQGQTHTERHRETRKRQGNRNIKDPEELNPRTHSKAKTPGGNVLRNKEQETREERRMEKERGRVGVVWAEEAPSGAGAFGGSHRWQWAGSLRQSPITHQDTKTGGLRAGESL